MNETDAPEPHGLLSEVLGSDLLCNSMMDFLTAAYLGRNEFSRELIEADLLERKDTSWKRRTLKLLIDRLGLQHDPYSSLASELDELSTFRNRVAHSQPDHGNPLRRLRRANGRNQPVWLITEEEVRAQRGRGMACQSQLAFVTMRVMGDVEAG